MAFEFKLPDIGEGLTEGEVVKWLVKEGDIVEDDQPMVEVMTDKATVEITAPKAGRIAEIRAKEGATIPVGDVMVVIDDGSEGGGATAAPPKGATEEPPAEAEPREEKAPAREAPAREPEAAGRPAPPPPRRAGAPPAAPREREPRRPAGGEKLRERTLAAPATRKLARELGVDLDAVPASGPNDRVTREDVERFARRPAAAPAPAGGAVPAPGAQAGAEGRMPVRPPAPAAGATARDERIPLRGMRAKIADQMVRSKQHAPHFTYADECDMTEVAALREKAKPLAEERGIRLTYLPFIIKALVSALKRHPIVNALVDDDAKEYVLRKEYNIGIATDTEAGLMVPVIKHADRRSLLDIAAELESLTALARARKIELEDLKGSTITITSAGSIGGILATPILNYPEVAILGVYRVKEKPVVRDGEIVIRKMTNLTITLDHRIVDGATAARFLNDVIRLLESPGLMLLEDA